MKDVCGEGQINRSFLERLSTEELIRMADHYGVDIPPDLERVFVIEQLLEFAEEEDESVEEEAAQPFEVSLASPLIEADFPEQACLPKHYNISFMEVMIRDPLWAFVFWELKSSEKESLEAAPDFEAYYLKVSSVYAGGENNNAPKTRMSFSVPVGNDDTAWYLGFPPADKGKTTNGLSYQVELCAQKGGAEFVLVSSAVFRLPALAPKKSDEQRECLDLRSNDGSLAFLSGIDNLPILRNGDRQSRMKVRGDSFPEPSA